MDTPVSHERNADQIAYWNGPAGERWTERQSFQDILLEPVTRALIEHARLQAGDRVVDIGCGCGSTSVAAAQSVAPSGFVLGIDVSAPMLARARQLAPQNLPMSFVLADATVYPFEPATYDLLLSRFGVMFFADPAVSFANLRRALRSSGRLAFVCWREPRDNPWMMAPLQAAYKHVPKLPQVGPDDPGPFSFASRERVERVLREASFSDIGMEPFDIALDLAIGRGLESAVQSAVEIGPTNRALEGQPEDVKTVVRHSVRDALAPFVRGQSVPLPAAMWIVTARTG
jgi:ubiquinone/menaquinone biosynthesis C-methylase UbiE